MKSPSLVLIAFLLLLELISPITISSAIPVAFPPVHSSKPIKIGNTVNVYQYYSKEPAPMGVADFGINQTTNGSTVVDIPFIRESTQWEGKVFLVSLSATSSLKQKSYRYSVSFQLNVVLNYEYNGNSEALWVQDVALYNTKTHEITFVDNIWNLTTSTAKVAGVSGNGKIYGYRSTTYYAYTAPSSDPGNDVYLTLPTTIYLLVNVTVNSQGQPVIYFWYNDGYGWVNYDTVTVNAPSSSNVYFLVDGYNYTGDGLFYDAELIMGGPGGGSTAQMNSGTLYFQLFYWNGTAFHEIMHAFNFGSNTAETVSNVVDQAYYNSTIEEYEAELTPGSGSLGYLW